MKSLTVKRKNDKDWSRHFLESTNYKTLFDQDIMLRKEDGSPLLCLKKNALTTNAIGTAYPILKSIRQKTENRGTSTGIKARPRMKQDGTMSSVQRLPKGWEVMSAIIGYFEREVRRPLAHPCAWNQKDPQAFAGLFPYLREVSDCFKENIPDRYAIQKDWCDRSAKDWIIPGTVFTTITVNHNYRTAAHKDAGDLEEGFSCMSYFRSGQFEGGHLVLPSYEVAVKLETGDVVMFDAHEYHGNTQIIPLTEKYDRCTVVHYYRTNIIKCKSAEEEIERAKNRKLGDPLYE